jgi:hypothetical protein
VVAILPNMPFGVQTGQLDIPFCINMNPGTQLAVLERRDLKRSGAWAILKFVVMNGHGGNDFRQMLRELQPQVGIFLCAIDWYRVVGLGGFFEDLGDHAGEMETSLMMHLAPELVLPLSEAGDGRERKPRIAAFRERWAWAPRRWTQVSADTGVGDPRAATADRAPATPRRWSIASPASWSISPPPTPTTCTRGEGEPDEASEDRRQKSEVRSQNGRKEECIRKRSRGRWPLGFPDELLSRDGTVGQMTHALGMSAADISVRSAACPACP